MARKPHTLGPFVAYHGCDRTVAEAVLRGDRKLRPSTNDYDWLGSGIYFWVDSPERGLEWAREAARRKASTIEEPYVLGALIYPGLCLNLTDYGAMKKLEDAYRIVEVTSRSIRSQIPVNSLLKDGIFLRRALDCAVINTVHQLRNENRNLPYDTVYGVFEEGGEVYPQAGFRRKTHVQIAVRNTDCIIGYFRVDSR